MTDIGTDHKIDEILACVRNIEARDRPVAEDMCATIRWITEEIPEGRGVPFLDDAVRNIVAALQQAQAKVAMLDTLRQDQEAAIAALGRSLVVAKFDVDFKHEQWQAAVGLGQSDRQRRQRIQADLRDLLVDIEAVALATTDRYAEWIAERLREILGEEPSSKENP